jgi:hypothetical protein
MSDLSSIRKNIIDTEKKRFILLSKLLKSKPFIAAQVYERFKTCGNKNCKCKKGQLHGPFLWLYQKKKNRKLISTTVHPEKKVQAKELAHRYKILLSHRQELREIDRQISSLLDSMVNILEEEVNEYVTKRDPGRPKKNR